VVSGGLQGYGELGFFETDEELGFSRETTGVMVDGIDAETRLAWLGDEALLLRTRRVLQRVSAFPSPGDEAITLAAPRPEGYDRFEVLPLGSRRFLVCYPDRLEAWDLEPRLGERYEVAVPHGYLVDLASGAPLMVVVTETEARLLSTEDGSVQTGIGELSWGGDGSWEVKISPSGEYVAYQDGYELYVRRVGPSPEDRSRHVPGRVEQFTWGPDGKSLALWTGRECRVIDAADLSFSGGGVDRPPIPRWVHGFERAEQIRGMHWLGPEALLTTLRESWPRKPRVVVERIDAR
jgi:hypothetical protein